jgi:hypothetical protein
VGWESRGNAGREYYYRRHRVAGRQVREYLGRGDAARLAAAVDAARRRLQEIERDRRLQERWRRQPAEGLLRGLELVSGLLLELALLRAGYHRPNRGPWRCRRARVKGGPKVDASGGQLPEPGREDGDEIRAVLERAARGDASALPEARAILDRYPVLAEHYGDLGRQAQAAWLDLVAGPDLLLREALERRLESLRRELTGPAAGAVERLLVARVLACTVQTEYADALAAQTRSARPDDHRLLLERQERAQRGLLAALKALALHRKLASSSGPAGGGALTSLFRPAV